MEHLFQKRILEHYPKLTPSQIALSRYILKNIEEIPFLSITALSNKIPISESIKGAPEAVAACLGGHVDGTAQNSLDLSPYIRDGRTSLLIAFSDERWESAPDVPTAGELGYRAWISWAGLGGPKGLPSPIIEKLRQIFEKAYSSDEFQIAMKRLNVPAEYRSGDEFKQFVEKLYKEHEEILMKMGMHKSQKKG